MWPAWIGLPSNSPLRSWWIEKPHVHILADEAYKFRTLLAKEDKKVLDIIIEKLETIDAENPTSFAITYQGSQPYIRTPNGTVIRTTASEFEGVCFQVHVKPAGQELRKAALVKAHIGWSENKWRAFRNDSPLRNWWISEPTIEALIPEVEAYNKLADKSEQRYLEPILSTLLEIEKSKAGYGGNSITDKGSNPYLTTTCGMLKRTMAFGVKGISFQQHDRVRERTIPMATRGELFEGL